MNKGLLFLVALMAFVAFSSARPLMFFADQTDAFFGISSGSAGITFAYATKLKGQNSHRVRFIGAAHLTNDTITDAYLMFLNKTVVEHLAFNSGAAFPYFRADYRMNDSIMTAMAHEELYIAVASKNHVNGTIAGYFRCRPYQGISFLSTDGVVGTAPNSSAIGIGWASLDISTIFSLPQDVIAQDNSITSNTAFSGRVIHEADNATVIGFYGPANATETASVLSTATLYNSPTNDGKFASTNVTADFLSIAIDDTYFQVTALNGDIRGQVYALLTPTRRAIPYAVDTVNGITNVPAAGFGTLRYANMEGTDKNSNSFVSAVATTNPTNFTYLAVYTFKAATNKKNSDLVRAITIEMNVQITGTGTWLFEVFDDSLKEFLPIGTLSQKSAGSGWTPAFIDSFSLDTTDYATSHEQMIIRVSVNSASSTSILFDLFGIRSWTPSFTSNQVFKAQSKALSFLPAQFINGTIIGLLNA